MDFERTIYSSGAPLEEKLGYSRMIKTGPFVFVGGTTSVQPDGTVYGENDAYAQAKYILEKQVKLLEKAGVKKEEVVRIKGYAKTMQHSGDIARAYSEIFKPIKPIFCVVGVAELNRPAQLIEFEMEAIIGSAQK